MGAVFQALGQPPLLYPPQTGSWIESGELGHESVPDDMSALGGGESASWAISQATRCS